MLLKVSLSRVQLAINVADLDEAIAFYTKLFDTTPAKVRPGYANFAVVDPPLKLVLIENPDGAPGSLDHLGVEVATTDEVTAAQARLSADGLATAVETATACCYAVQDKVWVDGPGASRGRSTPCSPTRRCQRVRCARPSLEGRRAARLAPTWPRRPRAPTRAAEPPTRPGTSGGAGPMSDVVSERPRPGTAPDAAVITRLSFLDRLLPVWIVAAMALGILLGRVVPSLDRRLGAVQVTSGTSLPIFIGLLVMMSPVLAKVRYGHLGSVTRDRRLLVASLALNWLVGPAVMFALAWALLPDQPTYRTGLIIVGLARCIAMVLIWNDLSGGDREAAAVLVAINSLFQIVAFAFLGYFYLNVLPGWLNLSTVGIHLSVWRIAQTVLIFLGIPLVAGFATRTVGERSRGREWYETRFLPRLGPFALYGLLFTIVVLFALQGHAITTRPTDVARIALPLLAYFAIMWTGALFLGRAIGLPYERSATLAFTAAGNNFELAIAVAIGVFGVTSGQALAGVVGPLIEVPVLVALVYVARWARPRLFPATQGAEPGRVR